jgi:hypothetical protein
VFGATEVIFMSKSSDKLTRGEALRGLVVLPALAGLLASTTSIAQAKSSKSQVKYQSHPNGTQKCSGCRFFHPGKTASANGTCSIVEGAISPNGWCIAYAAK